VNARSATGVAAQAIDAAVTEGTVTPLPATNLNILRGSTTGLSPALGTPRTGPLQSRSDLQRVIERSSALAAQDVIQVVSDGSGVVLRGVVVSDYDRRLAELLLRLSPGVGSIRNELLVRAAPVKAAAP
jgi:hypothetical protein